VSGAEIFAVYYILELKSEVSVHNHRSLSEYQILWKESLNSGGVTNIKRTNNHLSSQLNTPNTKKRPRHMTLDIQVLAWYSIHLVSHEDQW